MFKKPLYKYKNENGRVVISPNKPDVEYELMYRLIADTENHILTNLNVCSPCVDILPEELSLWFEIPQSFEGDLNLVTAREIANLRDKTTIVEEENQVQNEVLDTTLMAIDEVYINTEEDSANQYHILDTTLLAIDELFLLLEPIFASMPMAINSNEEVKNPMVELYVVMIQRGLKTIDQVPERYREEVRELLEQIEE